MLPNNPSPKIMTIRPKINCPRPLVCASVRANHVMPATYKPIPKAIHQLTGSKIHGAAGLARLIAIKKLNVRQEPMAIGPS